MNEIGDFHFIPLSILKHPLWAFLGGSKSFMFASSSLRFLFLMTRQTRTFMLETHKSPSRQGLVTMAQMRKSTEIGSRCKEERLHPLSLSLFSLDRIVWARDLLRDGKISLFRGVKGYCLQLM